MQRNIQSWEPSNDPQDNRCPWCGANLIYDTHAWDCPIKSIGCGIEKDEEDKYEY